jgi:hypothetical protein
MAGRAMSRSTDANITAADVGAMRRAADDDELLPQLVAHLREHRTTLRQDWAGRIQESGLLLAMTPQEMAAETTSVYDNYVEVLETGSVEALQRYARDLSERIIPRGVETHEVVGIVLLLRDVLARFLFEKYQRDFGLLNRVLDAYEPAANRIANTVAVSFVEERERVIRQQQDSIRELSTPVLPGPGAAADPADHRRPGQRAGAPAHRAAAHRYPDAPGEGRRHRHHRCPGRRRGGGQSPRPDRRRQPPHGCQRDHHRAVAADRPDTGDDRRRPEQDEHHR